MSARAYSSDKKIQAIIVPEEFESLHSNEQKDAKLIITTRDILNGTTSLRIRVSSSLPTYSYEKKIILNLKSEKKPMFEQAINTITKSIEIIGEKINENISVVILSIVIITLLIIGLLAWKTPKKVKSKK